MQCQIMTCISVCMWRWLCNTAATGTWLVDVGMYAACEHQLSHKDHYQHETDRQTLKKLPTQWETITPADVSVCVSIGLRGYDKCRANGRLTTDVLSRRTRTVTLAFQFGINWPCTAHSNCLHVCALDIVTYAYLLFTYTHLLNHILASHRRRRRMHDLSNCRSDAHLTCNVAKNA